MKFICKIAVVLTSVMLCSCGSEEKALKNYEKPVQNLLVASEHSDTDGYLNCFTPQAKEAYLDSEAYDENLCEKLLENGKYSDVDFTTNSSEELSEDELSSLEKEYKSKYKKKVTMKKGERLQLKLSALKDEETFYDSLEIIVVRINESWYIYGDVIEEFDFSASK